MSVPAGPDPFALLGLPARDDLTDDDVRAAWRRLAAATHPDRADGGDPGRFAAAAAAYTVLRTRSGRSEALTDLAGQAGRHGAAGAARPRAGRKLSEPAGTVAPAGTAAARVTAATAVRYHRLGGARLLRRIRRGRPARLALRVAIVAVVSTGTAAAAGLQPATPALITGAVTWLLLTARHDLAPPGQPGRVPSASGGGPFPAS